MKGVVLAGGNGTRLHPLTRAMSKHLLPVHDVPMIYYPLAVLMRAGIRELLVVCTPRDLPRYRELLGDGAQWGVSLRYAMQPAPEGVAHALLVAREFLAGEPCALVLGDNVFHGPALPGRLRRCVARQEREGGATIFTQAVTDPERYGVVELDEAGRPLRLEEKPARPRTRQAVAGLYLYDGEACALAASLPRSARGEYEITELNRRYLERGRLRAEPLGTETLWLDVGTHAALREASAAVAAIEREHGLKPGCLEEIAWREGFIGDAEFARLAAAAPDGEYGDYLRRLLEQA